MPHAPITSRPLDLVYVGFFASHIFASLLVDFQAAFFPAHLVPSFARQLLEFYVKNTSDPIIGGMSGFFPSDHLAWLKSFFILELLIQFPLFFLGIHGLIKDCKRIYMPLILYGASTATTTLACIATVIHAPSPTPALLANLHVTGIVPLTTSQKTMLLASYVPYCVIPLLMALDLGYRVQKIVNASVKASAADKRK